MQNNLWLKWQANNKILFKNKNYNTTEKMPIEVQANEAKRQIRERKWKKKK